MHLKKIELSGFKSFCDPTELIFEKGVTCVVGPNGCGKSNISDSIRWVLGERSAKLLRGSKMEDVIFQGTDTRKPVNFAEVSLTIDNSDHSLPIQYDEVVITRRLHRSGESEYLINKTACRLKDVQSLILDTGLGSNTYSMIEQGRIDYILNAEADERRFLIEEAAGISKFKVKKEEALRKLDHTDQNLLRLNDIIAEVERNIKYAERQAKRAEKFKEHHEKLKKLELTRLAHSVEKIKEQISSYSTEHDNLKSAVAEVSSQLNTLTESLRSVESEYNAAEDAFLQSEQKRINSEHQLTSTNREKETAQERYHETKTQIAKTEHEIEGLSETLRQLTEDLAKKESEISVFEQKRVSIEQEKSAFDQKLSSLQEELSGRAVVIKQYRDQNYEIASRLASAKNELSKITFDSSNRSEKKDKINQNAGKTAQEIDQLKTEIASAKQTLENLALEIEVGEEKTAERFEQKTQSVNALAQTSEEIVTVKEKLSLTVHRMELLNELDGAGYACVKEMLDKRSELGDVEPDSINAFLDLLEIEEGFEIAVAAVLADVSKAVVANDTKTAIQLLTHIQTKGHHQATILIRDLSKNQNLTIADPDATAHELVQARLIDKITIKQGYEGMFHALLGDVYVVDEITHQNSIRLAPLTEKIRIVSKKGTYLSNGFHLGLRNGSVKPIQDYLSREREKSELIQTADQLSVDLIRLNELKLKIDAELKELEIKMKEDGEQQLAQQIEFQRQAISVRSAEERLAKCVTESELNKTDLWELSEEEQDQLKHRGQLEHSIAELEQEEREILQQLKTEDVWQEQKKNEKESLIIEVTRFQTRIETQAAAEAQLIHTAQFLKTSYVDCERRLNDYRQNVEEFNQRLTSLKARSEELGLQAQQLQADLIVYSTESSQKKEVKERLAAQKAEAAQKNFDFQTQLSGLNTKFYDSEKKTLELEYQKTSAMDKIRNTYQINFSEEELAQHLQPEINLEVLEAELGELKTKVESIGTVNLLAIDEYEEMKQRFEFMSKQKRDLEESKEQLVEAIRKINRETKKLFDETFIKVREMFQAYFKILFEGGQADLILVDETNPLDSGIDIVARPPGKKPQHISLLSGGEKALTAMALLFALFKVKPSPFCVLDEVDAPLDEANNERFVRVVKEFITNTQFVIVTHSRKTISMGNTLYGVTMEEPGVSKIVSVRVGTDGGSLEHENSKIQKELNTILQ